jgi:hypothetical protein
VLTSADLEEEGYEQTKKPWSEEEDRLLLRLCRNEHARFEQIAALIEGRNAKMCYSRYRRLTYQTRVGWSKSENQRLLELVAVHGEDWKLLAGCFPRKSEPTQRAATSRCATTT